MMQTARRLAGGGLALLVLIGCKSNPKVDADTANLGMLLPKQIKIQPFTKIKSFDDDRVPDGVAVVVRPTDQFGDPVKLVGHVYFELYAYQNASAERKGERIEFWDRTIATEKDQKLYWDRTAQMYEFPLGWTQGIPSSPSRKFVLTVTYRTPWNETLTDEHILDFAVSKEQVAGTGVKPKGR